MSLVASIPPSTRFAGFGRSIAVLSFALALLVWFHPPARAETLAAVAPEDVDVALVLAADVSLSMDQGELSLQRTGYADALESPEVLMAIQSGHHKRIAIAFFEWGGISQQVVVAPWTIVDGEDAARRLAAKIRSAPVNSLDRTAIGEALTFANRLFDETALKTDRKVVDVSGDGINNLGRSVALARATLVERGVTINALPIMPKADEWSSYMPPLDSYYDECVVGGVGSFTLPVEGMTSFSTGLKMKLILEIAGVPQTDPRVMPAAGPAPVRCQDFD